MSYYIFWPFGKYVERSDESHDDDEDRTHENNGDLHNDVFSTNEDHQVDENRPLLGRRTSYGELRRIKREKLNVFERLGNIGAAGLVFYFWFFLLIGKDAFFFTSLSLFFKKKNR